MGARRRAGPWAARPPGARSGAELSPDRVQALLEAVRTDVSSATGPRPEFRDALRARLLAVASVQVPEPPPASGRWARLGDLALGRPSAYARDGLRPVPSRRSAVLAGALAVLIAAIALTGVGIAGGRSLPGQPFYGAKQANEALQLRRTHGDLDRGLAHLHLAEARLREVRALAAGKGSAALSGGSGSFSVLAGGASTAELTSTLAAMDAQTRTGSRFVRQAVSTTGDRTPLTVLSAWSGQQGGRLRSVVPILPAAAQDRAELSLALLRDVGATAQGLLGQPAPGGPAPSPSATPTSSVTPGAAPLPGATTRAPEVPAAASPGVPHRSTREAAVPSPASLAASAAPRRPAPTRTFRRPVLPAGPVLPTRPTVSPPGLPLPTLPLPTLPLPTLPLPTLSARPSSVPTEASHLPWPPASMP